MGRFARVAAALGGGLGAAVLTAAPPAAAQVYEAKPLAELLPPGVAYDPSVPTPESVTGFRTGDLVLPFELIAAYVRAVDAASDRVSVETIGRSHLGRPILAVSVTSEANQARLAEIRSARQAVLEGGPAGAEQPIVIEIVHGAHGDEPSGFDVAPLLLYHLAAAEDATTRALRDAAVVTQIVTLNPDGDARGAAWINDHRAAVPVAHPAHREREAGFPGGRGNHYWFDLNRQWLPVTQPESAAVVGWAQDWLPHVVADLHEMGGDASYFFSPGPEDGLHPLIAEDSFALSRALSGDIAAAADQEGRLYVTEEYFDDYYLGYGSSYPALLGAIAYTFEQSATRGLVYDGADGPQRYDDKIAEHFRTTTALIEAAVARRADLQDYQRRYFERRRADAASDPVKAYVFASPDRGRLRAFLALLAAHRLEVRALARDVEVGGVRFAAGEAFVLTLDQPRRAVALGLFETRIPEDKADFYDITGWTMPLAFGIDYAPLDRRAFGAGLLGAAAGPEAVARPDPPPVAPYAYVLEWGSRHAPRAVHRALAADLHARVLPAPAQVRTEGGLVDAPRGAVVIPVADQPLDPAAIRALATRAALEDDVTVHAAVSGLTPGGPDLGGFDLEPLEAPRVLLLTGQGVSPEAAGEVWRLLDREMAIPVTMIDVEDIDPSALYDFNRLVMVDGAYAALPDQFAVAVEAWMRAGGVLVATRGGASWAASAGLASARGLEGLDKESLAALPPSDNLPAYAERYRIAATNDISGAVFAIRIDPTHPIGFGYETGASHVHRAGISAYATAPGRFRSVAVYAEDALVSGYASPENQARLAGATAVFAERRGEGAVVLFADDPLFRGYWLASEKLFLNALFFARSITTADSSSYR
jgi:hypothetical protein